MVPHSSWTDINAHRHVPYGKFSGCVQSIKVKVGNSIPVRRFHMASHIMSIGQYVYFIITIPHGPLGIAKKTCLTLFLMIIIFWNHIGITLRQPIPGLSPSLEATDRGGLTALLWASKEGQVEEASWGPPRGPRGHGNASELGGNNHVVQWCLMVLNNV